MGEHWIAGCRKGRYGLAVGSAKDSQDELFHDTGVASYLFLGCSKAIPKRKGHQNELRQQYAEARVRQDTGKVKEPRHCSGDRA